MHYIKDFEQFNNQEELESLNENIKSVKADKEILTKTEKIENNSKKVLDYLKNFVILTKPHGKEFLILFGNSSFKNKKLKTDNWVVEFNNNKYVLIATTTNTAYECETDISEEDRLKFLEELKKSLK